MAKPIGQRAGDIEQIIEDLPGMLNLRFAQEKVERDEIKARLASLDAKVAGIDAKFAGIDARISFVELSIEELKLELGALPRVIGQIITERFGQA